MVKLSYDLHIHSCLSPCGDENMTPANIVGMAVVKELDLIALTDHNTCRNTPAAKKVADEYGILFVPGIEITTQEDIHVLGYFPTVEKALKFDEYVYEKLIKRKNKAEIFGNQYIYNEEDQIVGEEENLLIGATRLAFDEVFGAVDFHGGVALPAHINKVANSLLGILGAIPQKPKFKSIEVFGEGTEIKEDISSFKIIRDSDAHYLENINEPINNIELKERSVEALIDYLKNT